VARLEASRPRGASLACRSLTFAYAGRPPALKEVSMRIAPGEYLALLGQNGAGKTTLAKHFIGLLRPGGGQVMVDDRDAADLSIGELAHTVGYAFQNPDHQIFAGTTEEEIAFGPRNLGLDEQDVAERVEEILEAFGLAALAETPPAMLGYGTRRKVALASVFAMRPRALILDEPTSGLDRRSVVELMSRLAAYVEQGHSVMVITHDVRLVADHIPRCAVLNAGELIALGDTHEVLTNPEIDKATGLGLPPVGELARRLGLDAHRLPLDVVQFRQAYAQVRRHHDRGPSQ
jgi:energy-coupling factor transport system ATP-binding protein